MYVHYIYFDIEKFIDQYTFHSSLRDTVTNLSCIWHKCIIVMIYDDNNISRLLMPWLYAHVWSIRVGIMPKVCIPIRRKIQTCYMSFASITLNNVNT